MISIEIGSIDGNIQSDASSGHVLSAWGSRRLNGIRWGSRHEAGWWAVASCGGIRAAAFAVGV